MFAVIFTMSNMTANGIKFNGQNYDDRIEYVKLSIAPNVKPSQPKTGNVREFVAEIKKCTMIDIVDKYIVAAHIDDLSNREYTIAQSMDEHITHMVDTYNRLKGLDMNLGERVLVEFMLKSCKGDDFKQFQRTYNQLKEKWSLSDTKAMLMQEEARQREELKVKLLQANIRSIMVIQMLVLVAAKLQVRN
ncbi:hypothetical protein V6N13_048176 [Hibiscus sabdariffa]